MPKLFVYGTLKQGYGNHRHIRGATFLGEARLDGYCIYSLGGFPGISPLEDSFVIGELYEITDEMLDRCDYLEGVDLDQTERGMYRRETVTTNIDEGHRHENHETFVYVYNTRSIRGRTIITDGRWERQ